MKPPLCWSNVASPSSNPTCLLAARAHPPARALSLTRFARFSSLRLTTSGAVSSSRSIKLKLGRYSSHRSKFGKKSHRAWRAADVPMAGRSFCRVLSVAAIAAHAVFSAERDHAVDVAHRLPARREVAPEDARHGVADEHLGGGRAAARAQTPRANSRSAQLAFRRRAPHPKTRRSSRCPRACRSRSRGSRAGACRPSCRAGQPPRAARPLAAGERRRSPRNRRASPRRSVVVVRRRLQPRRSPKRSSAHRCARAIDGPVDAPRGRRVTPGPRGRGAAHLAPLLLEAGDPRGAVARRRCEQGK